MASIIGKKKRVGDMVLDEIKRMIRNEELKEGEKLPSQIEFAAHLGVSRASLREALYTLGVMGVIEQKPGVGTVLLSSDTTLWNEQPSSPRLSDPEAAIELLELYVEMEVLMIHLAIDSISTKELKNMETTIEDMSEAIQSDDKTRYKSEELSFHYQIAKATNNRYFIYSFISVRNLMEEFMDEAFEALPGFKQNSHEDHIAIYKALKEKDKKEAVAATRKYIQNIENELKGYSA